MATILLLIVCSFFDLRYYRIPNFITVPAVVLGLAIGFVSGGTDGLVLSAVGMAVGFGVFLVPFILGGMGGGDVKLMAAVGALVGWPLVVWAALLSCVVGLFAAVAKAIWKGTLWMLLVNTWQITRNMLVGLILRRPAEEIKTVTRIQSAARVPFGVAIAVGTLWAMLLQYLVAKGIVQEMPYFF